MAEYIVTIKNSDECMLGGIGPREIAMTDIDASVIEYERQVDEALDNIYGAGREYIEIYHEYGPFGGPSINVLSLCDDDGEGEVEISPVVSSVISEVFDRGSFWVAYPDTLTAARARISRLDLDDDAEFIFADWPEGAAHIEWLLVAKRDDIIDWIDANK